MSFQTQTFNNLAVAGMDAAWGGCEGLDDFERLIYTGALGIESPSPQKRPNGKVQAGTRPALLAEVARRALADAGFDPDRPRAARIAGFFAGAEALPGAWNWAAKLVDLSTEANPLATAVLMAQQLLESGTVEAAVFAACAGPLALPEDAPLALEAKTLGFDRNVHGWRLGDGAGAVVLVRRADAVREGRRIYAELRALAFAGGAKPGSPAAVPVPPALDHVRGCCLSALQAAGVSAQQVGYIEAFASGVDALDGVEIAGLAQAYRQPELDLSTALGSAQSNLGYLGAASGLAGLVQAVLCLHHRMIPGSAGWSAPKLPALWRSAPFYVPVESRAWFRPPHGTGRLAGLSLPGLQGSYAHIVLSESAEQVERPNRALELGGLYLIPLPGDGLDHLRTRLEDLARALDSGPDLDRLAAEYHEAAIEGGDANLGISIIGRSAADLLREIEMAQRALPQAVEKGGEWQTPAGSYFTANPVGRLGSVALVYPGAFNSYPGVGKDLLRLFPGLHQHAESVTSDLGAVFRERMLFPRSLSALSKEDMSALEAKLLADPISMLISGAALAILYTYILREEFGIQPSAAFGYSLGENSMMFATGVWAQGDEAAARLEASESFRLRLAGPQMAIREHWGVGGVNGSGEQALWNNYLVMAPAEKVQEAIRQESRVYLTHINTPRQVVIGGDPQACQRVVTALKSSSLQAPFDYALHCEVMRSEYSALADMHDWPVENRPQLQMFSAADYGPVNIDRGEISQKIAHMLTTPLDFPRLIQTVYNSGARVFIEAGAGSNCARWIDETLKSSPHLSLSLNRRGTDDYTTLVRTLARLFSHRVPANMERLYSTTKVRQIL
jgi:PfaB family protein